MLKNIAFDTCQVKITSKERDLTYTSSGTLIFTRKHHKGFVICNGSIVKEFLCKFVYCNKDDEIFHNIQNHDFHFIISYTNGGNECTEMLPGEFFLLWKCQKLSRELQRLFGYDWKLKDEEKDVVKSEKSQQNLNEELSWFCLLGINSLPSVPEMFVGSTRFHLRSGTKVWTRSCPFDDGASSVFANCVSKGVISVTDNKHDPIVFITDARCLPGSECGIVYHSKVGSCHNKAISIRSIVGFILAPICWKSNEIVGLTICISANALLQSLFHAVNKLSIADENSKWIHDFKSLKLTDLISSDEEHRHANPDIMVPYIECGASWGSGVVVALRHDSVYIATCKHVVKRHEKKSRIRIKLSNFWTDGALIFQTDELSSLDFALVSIKLDENVREVLREKCGIIQPWCIEYGKEPHMYKQGTDVLSIGHGLFDSTSLFSEITTEGVVSKVVSCHGSPLLLHCSCHVHRGSSGGALVASDSGNLLGLLVNNIRDEDIKMVFTDVSFAIPACVFMGEVLMFVKSLDRNNLYKLNKLEPDFNKAWQLFSENHIQSKL